MGEHSIEGSRRSRRTIRVRSRRLSASKANDDARLVRLGDAQRRAADLLIAVWALEELSAERHHPGKEGINGC